MDEWGSIPISRLAHAGYCLRRAALLTNEQVWSESADTAKGRAEHERVHTSRTEHRGSLISLYEYPVFSKSLGISGKCDCIEAEKSDEGCKLPDIDFSVKLYPVEYKHGSVREEPEYELQLCAQAMCLEEMYGTVIEKGAIFYISSHRRLEVKLDDELRQRVRETLAAVERIRREFYIPPAEYSQKCRKCSINELCMPRLKRSAAAYCAEIERMAKEDEAP